MSKDDTALVRQWNLIRTLSARRYALTIDEMVLETDVSDKSIRRDLQLFQQLGFPLNVSMEGRGKKRYRMDSNWDSTQPFFPFEELIALYLGRRFLEPLIGTPF